jgi:hypothetical protein
MSLMIQRPIPFRAKTLAELSGMLVAALVEARTLRVGQPSPFAGRHGARDWELTRWFKRVALFMDGACHVAAGRSDVEALLSVSLDADARSLSHWGLRRWRDGQWELDNLELDFQLRARPAELLHALEAFSDLLHASPAHAADAMAWDMAG